MIVMVCVAAGGMLLLAEIVGIDTPSVVGIPLMDAVPLLLSVKIIPGGILPEVIVKDGVVKPVVVIVMFPEMLRVRLAVALDVIAGAS